MAQKTITNSSLVTATGQPMRTGKFGPPAPDTPLDSLLACSLALAVRDFCLVLWGQKGFTGNYADTKTCDRIIEATNKAATAQTFSLDDADYDWLVKKLEEHGPAVFHEKCPRILEPLKNQVEKQEAPKA